MTVSVSTLILNSLINIGERQIGGTFTSTENAYYLGKLNTMLDGWSIERLMCYSILQESFGLSVGVGSYTIGSGGTFNTTRPTKIAQAFIRDSDGADSPLTILGQDAYDGIVLKSSGNTIPGWLFYDSGFTGGLGTIKLYPVPSGSLTLYIDSWQQLQQFADVSTALQMPPGYQRAIESNFSVECSPGYKPPDAALVMIAKTSKAAIKSINIPDMMMSTDLTATYGSRHSILTGP